MTTFYVETSLLQWLHIQLETTFELGMKLKAMEQIFTEARNFE